MWPGSNITPTQGDRSVKKNRIGVTIVLALVLAACTTVSNAQAPTDFKVLEGDWDNQAPVDKVIQKIGPVGANGVPAPYEYIYKGRSLDIQEVKASKDGKQIKLYVHGKAGFELKVDYSDTFGGMLRGKIKPSGSAQEYDVTYYRKK